MTRTTMWKGKEKSQKSQPSNRESGESGAEQRRMNLERRNVVGDYTLRI